MTDSASSRRMVKRRSCCDPASEEENKQGALVQLGPFLKGHVREQNVAYESASKDLKAQNHNKKGYRRLDDEGSTGNVARNSGRF